MIDAQQLECVGEGQDAGRNAVEHRGQIAVRLRQCLPLFVDLRRHVVERFDEPADLVRGGNSDAMSVPALGKSPGCLGQRLDRNGDAPRGIDRRPQRAEENGQRHRKKERRLRGLERRPLRVHLFEVLVGQDRVVDQAAHPRRNEDPGDSDVRCRTHAGRHTDPLPARPDVDLRCVPGSGDVIEKLLRRLGDFVNRCARVGDDADQRAVPVEADHVDAVELLNMIQTSIELRRIARLAADGNFSRRRRRRRRRLVFRHPGDRFAIFEDAADRRVEPAVDRGAQQIRGEEKEDQHRDQRRGHPRHGQLRPEPRADDAALTLEHELDDTAQQDEEDAEDQEDVDVPEDEEQHLAAERLGRELFRFLHRVVDEARGRQDQQRQRDDDARVFAVAEQRRPQRHRASSGGEATRVVFQRVENSQGMK